MIEVTSRQNEYLKELATGPKLSNDLVCTFEISAASISKMICILRDKGLVQSKLAPATGRGGTRIYSLIKSYEELVEDGLKVVACTPHRRISEGELQYATELREAGMVGQRLVAAYQLRFPKRTPQGVRHIIEIVRKRGVR